MNKFYFTNFIAVEVCGFAGGIWVFWDHNSVNAEVIFANDQVVNMCITSENGRSWFLTIVYASPNPMYQSKLWENTTRMRALMTAPWLIIGDVNQVTEISEKRGGNRINMGNA